MYLQMAPATHRLFRPSAMSYPSSLPRALNVTFPVSLAEALNAHGIVLFVLTREPYGYPNYRLIKKKRRFAIERLP